MTSIRALETRYAGIKFRSRTEARWAVAFDAMGLAYDYEPQGFAIRGGGYLPDFWLREWRVFFEVKGEDPTIEECAKCAELSVKSECVVLIATGAPAERFQIRWFGPEGEREHLYALAHDRYGEGGFWLVAGDDTASLGPYSGGQIGGPCFSPMEAVFELATSERFGAERRTARHAPVSFPPDAHPMARISAGTPKGVSPALWKSVIARGLVT